MKYRKLGSSDLEVSEISLGSWLTYGVGVEAEAARRCLDEALAEGINFIDTANVYGRGAAETFLGEALQGRPRDSYILATKLYFPMSDSDRGLSRGQVEKQLDASLRRLRTDVIDLYQCHRYDWDTPLEETMEALHPYVAFLILPVFAFTAAGFAFGSETGKVILSTVSLGVAAGLFFGKQVGVFGAALLGVVGALLAIPTAAAILMLTREVLVPRQDAK